MNVFTDEQVAVWKSQLEQEHIISKMLSVIKVFKDSLIFDCPFEFGNEAETFIWNRETETFKCWNCGAEGDIIKLYMMMRSIDYPQAVSELSKKTGVTLETKPETDTVQLIEANKYAADYYKKQLKKNTAALNYLLKRDIAEETKEVFSIGYAPDALEGLYRKMISEGFVTDVLERAGLIVKVKNGTNAGNYIDRFKNRIMIPIYNTRKEIIAFGGRTLSNDKKQAKYMNSPETPLFQKRKTLFACNEGLSSDSPIILTEGYFDVISLYQSGIRNSAATMGTALSVYQARLLNMISDNTIIAYDADNAGFKAVMDAGLIFRQTGISGKALKIEGAKYPDEFIEKFGADRFIKAINTAEDVSDYIFNGLKKKYRQANSKESQMCTFAELARFVSRHPSSLKRSAYLSGIDTALYQLWLTKQIKEA